MRSIEEEYKILNKMIKEDRIKFRFLNESDDLELLQFCINKENNTLEFEFRDVMKEHIEELKILLEKYKIICRKMSNVCYNKNSIYTKEEKYVL